MRVNGKWPVWSEGYCATGESAPAKFHGYWEGETFLEACRKWSVSEGIGSDYHERDGKASYWGCRLYDNEEDARKNFG